MKAVVLDKIASVTRACGLKREVRVSATIPCEEGVVVAVRVLHDKSTYNVLELPSGRMAQVKRGDVVAGALGHRQALFGYSGHLPERLAPGDTVLGIPWARGAELIRLLPGAGSRQEFAFRYTLGEGT